MHGIGSEAAGHSFINKHNTWTGPNLPSMGIVYPIDCFLVHEEERVTILLNTGLEAVGSCDGAITAVWSALNEENSLALLSADHEAGLDDIWKDKHGQRSR